MKKSPKPGDMNQRMYAVVQEAAGLSETPQKDDKAVERGRLGGLARAANLSADERKSQAEVARAARTAKESEESALTRGLREAAKKSMPPQDHRKRA